MSEHPRLPICLSAEDDVLEFRTIVRRLIAQGVEPERIAWKVSGAAQGDLLVASESPIVENADAGQTPPSHPPATPLQFPAALIAVFERAALHSDVDRHALLYRLMWRLAHEPGLRDDPLDTDRMQAESMARAVKRDMHKMTAFVRFRPVFSARTEAAIDDHRINAAHDESQIDLAIDDAEINPTIDTAQPNALIDDDWHITHVAWFEPDHHIVRAIAPFFARRFAQMRWAILTPRCSVRWNGAQLSFGPPALREQAPSADAAERLWLTYYQSIFNPARLKLKMMQKEMPRRYWKNLPEAVLIHPLAAQSAQRSGRMIEQPATMPEHRRPRASVRIAAAPPESVGSLEALRRSTQHCRRCPLGEFATQAVNGEGPALAKLMIVGETPGDQEDLRGHPFVGPAGNLLDKAFARLGWHRENVFLTNAVRHFKFELRGKRRIHKTPAQQEAAACLHWLESEIALVKPAAVIALGATAARSLMGRTVGVNRERGAWTNREDGLPILITLHPAALLRMDQSAFDEAFEAWINDLQLANTYATPQSHLR